MTRQNGRKNFKENPQLEQGYLEPLQEIANGLIKMEHRLTNI